MKTDSDAKLGILADGVWKIGKEDKIRDTVSDFQTLAREKNLH